MKIKSVVLLFVLGLPTFWQLRLMSIADRQDLPQKTTIQYWRNLLSGEEYSFVNERMVLLLFSAVHNAALDNSEEFDRMGGGLLSKHFGEGSLEMFTSQFMILKCDRRELCEEFLKAAKPSHL